MSSFRKRFLFICTILLIILWMFTSTHIIASIKNQTKEKLSSKIENTHQGLSFMEATDFTQVDTLYDTISLSGYIYNISSATDDDATRSLLLHSDQRTYIIPLTEIRSNAYTYYSEIDPKRKIFTGFGLEYSPLTIKNGEYSLIFQVEEKNIPVTRLDSGYILKKTKGHASLIYQPSQQIDPISEAELNGMANGGFSEMSFDTEGRLLLKGWGLIDGINSEYTQVILQVFNGEKLAGSYDTTKECITYIADYFNNSDYYSTGFKAAIPDITDENITVWLYVKYENKLYQYPYCFKPNNARNNLEPQIQ